MRPASPMDFDCGTWALFDGNCTCLTTSTVREAFVIEDAASEPNGFRLRHMGIV